MEVKEPEEKDESEEIHIKPNVIGKEHYFDYVTGTEVECRDCPLGYSLGGDLRVKSGRIYNKDKLVI